MNLDRNEASAMVETPRGVGCPTTSPQQENLNVVLDHAMAHADTALKYVGMMIAHVGGAQESDKDEPAIPGVLGKSFALRSQLQKLNGRLEALGKLL